jgi:hypothetical protein
MFPTSGTGDFEIMLSKPEDLERAMPPSSAATKIPD